MSCASFGQRIGNVSNMKVKIVRADSPGVNKIKGLVVNLWAVVYMVVAVGILMGVDKWVLT